MIVYLFKDLRDLLQFANICFFHTRLIAKKRKFSINSKAAVDLKVYTQENFDTVKNCWNKNS